MAVTSSIQMIGDKCVVGALDLSFLPGVPKVFPGTLVANGPVYFGLVPNPGVPLATVMIGPPIGLPTPLSLQVHGISNYFGILNVIAVSNFTGLCTKFGITIRNSASITNGVNTKNALNLGNAPSVFNGSTTTMGKAQVNGVINCLGVITCQTITAKLGVFSSVAAPFKFFDIPHPSKEFPHRLRYSCLEGPEIGVYVRGVLKATNEIELPYYWTDLVDDETITVQLTPIGKHQNLCYNIARMKDKTVIIVNPHDFYPHTIHCSYTVYAERKDVKKLVTEYEGAVE
tara:strand:+ start:498 stop:1355 length:858 start_codon:yes stop_codon:yes gene_type:complete